MREKAEKFLRANGDLMSDNFSTMKGGRLCVPVKVSQKQRVKGSVVEKSATGNTVFVEPEAVAKIHAELVAAEIIAENEEMRILYELADLIEEYIEEMYVNLRIMSELDFIFSKGNLSIYMEAVEPKISNRREIVLIDARHPLLKREECVPLQF